jgi:hypothetical protein
MTTEESPFFHACIQHPNVLKRQCLEGSQMTHQQRSHLQGARDFPSFASIFAPNVLKKYYFSGTISNFSLLLESSIMRSFLLAA